LSRADLLQITDITSISSYITIAHSQSYLIYYSVTTVQCGQLTALPNEPQEK